MKDAIESTAVERAPEPEPFTNRKLIRPTLPRPEASAPSERRERMERSIDRNDGAGHMERAERAGGRKSAPPEQTHAENFYYQKQMQARTPMVVVLRDGEQVRGIIEWYDKQCIKLTRNGSQPNLLVYKDNIKYLYKESEGNGRRNL